MILLLRGHGPLTVRYESGFSPADPQGSQQVTGAYGVPPGPGLDPVAAAVPQDTIIWLRDAQ